MLHTTIGERFSEQSHEWHSGLDSTNEVNFIIELMKLTGQEKILDIGCGNGRHAIELSKHGFDVTGIDLSVKSISEARVKASSLVNRCEFIHGDFLKTKFSKNFDVVLNMYDGGIGYFDDDKNSLFLEKISSVLRNGGKHFCNILNLKYYKNKCPYKIWKITADHLILTEYDLHGNRLQHSGHILKIGDVLKIKNKNPFIYRIFSCDEVVTNFLNVGLQVKNIYDGFSLRNASDELSNQLSIFSVKEKICLRLD